MSSQFEINPQTGDLMIKEQLDYETMMEGTFVVAVVVSFRMITQTYRCQGPLWRSFTREVTSGQEIKGEVGFFIDMGGPYGIVLTWGRYGTLY